MWYPLDGRCPVCQSDYSRGFAYLSGGALFLSEDGQDSIDTDRFQGFLHVGFHGKESDMSDSSGVTIVEDLHGGQFDLQWCSIRCMRKWLLDLLQKVESETGQVPTEES